MMRPKTRRIFGTVVAIVVGVMMIVISIVPYFTK